jgi:hypothetical protein
MKSSRASRASVKRTLVQDTLVGAPDSSETIAESKKYLADFTRVVNEHDTVEEIVREMLELHPNRDNPRVVWHSARQAVAKRR